MCVVCVYFCFCFCFCFVRKQSGDTCRDISCVCLCVCLCVFVCVFVCFIITFLFRYPVAIDLFILTLVLYIKIFSVNCIYLLLGIFLKIQC